MMIQKQNFVCEVKKELFQLSHKKLYISKVKKELCQLSHKKLYIANSIQNSYVH